jgi:protoheme ferro-lyase
MDMPIRERRLNIQFINEHLEKLQEIRNEKQTVTADKPLISKPNIKAPNDNPTYTSKVKKR